MAAAIVPLAKKAGEAASTAIRSDIFVYRRSWPAQTRTKKDGTEEVLVPERTAEAHVNGAGILSVVAAGAVGLAALGLAWLTWNGVKVKNPVPLGDRVLTIVPGMKDDPPFWLSDIIAAARARRDRHLDNRPMDSTASALAKAACLARGGTWDDAKNVCTIGTPQKDFDPEAARACKAAGGRYVQRAGGYVCELPPPDEYNPEAARACKLAGGKYTKQADGTYKCELP